MKPDPRRTAEAVELVRSVWPSARLLEMKETRHSGLPKYAIVRGVADSFLLPLVYGETVKAAWWNAVTRALNKVLTS